MISELDRPVPKIAQDSEVSWFSLAWLPVLCEKVKFAQIFRIRCESQFLRQYSHLIIGSLHSLFVSNLINSAYCSKGVYFRPTSLDLGEA